MTQKQAIKVLRQYLTRTGTKQAHLARDVGVSPGTVSRWLKGDRLPDVECALRIDTATGGAVPVEAWHPGVTRAA